MKIDKNLNGNGKGGSHVTSNPRTEKVPLNLATAYIPGTFQAAAPSADKTSKRWIMELYRKGYVFRGHWKWGDIVIDIEGIKPTRKDVFALYNHNRYEAAGFTNFIGVEGDLLIVKGVFLEGDKDTEPTATMVKNRMAQGAPMQCSGGFVPLKVEILEAGTKAIVNGVKHDGPKTIFRETDIVEASFCEMGWFQNSNAKLAAGADQGSEIEVAVFAAPSPDNAGAQTTSRRKHMAVNDALLASLKKIFGADRALTLFAAKPEAENIEAFAAEMPAVIEELRAENTRLTASLGEKETALKAKDGQIGKLEADLAKAKERPAVVTATGDSPEGGKPNDGKDGNDLKAKWEKNEGDVQAEFGSYEAFEMYHKRMTKEAK
jgi:hypothetical protein